MRSLKTKTSWIALLKVCWHCVRNQSGSPQMEANVFCQSDPGCNTIWGKSIFLVHCIEFVHFCTAPATVNTSLWQRQCYFCLFPQPSHDHLLIFLTRTYCSSECRATLRSSRGCLRIGDCLFLNLLLMRIKAKLDQSFRPSRGQPKH